jgi:hypothetical protein
MKRGDDDQGKRYQCGYVTYRSSVSILATMPTHLATSIYEIANSGRRWKE